MNTGEINTVEQVIRIEELAASALDGVIILYLLNSCFSKRTVKVDLYAIMYWALIFITAHFLGQNFVVQSVLLVLIISLYCRKRLGTGTFAGIIAGFAMNVGFALINMLTIFLVSIFSGNSIEQLISETSMTRVVVLILTKLTSMFVGIVIANTISHFAGFKMYQWIYICIYYFSTFAICALVSFIFVSVDLIFIETIIMLCIVILIVLLNIVTFFIILRINDDNRIEQENRMLNLQIKNQQNMIIKTSELYEQTREIRHDMKHYFTTFRGMLKRGETGLVIKEMNKILNNELQNVSVLNIDNPYLSASINDKLNVCGENDILMDVRINGEIPEIMSMDMALIVSNLLDNAIEAELNEQERYIKFFMQQEDKSIILEVRNHISNSVIGKGGQMKTHKKDKAAHGYGIKNVKKIIKKYNGYIDFKEEGQEFVVTMMIWI